MQVALRQSLSLSRASFGAARGMATLKEVNNRIKSVKNISKITKSMKMVAAAKLRRAQSLMAQTQAYVGGLQKFIQTEIPTPETIEAPVKGAERQKHLIIAVTTDKGLCGGVNSTVARSVRSLVKSEETAGRDTELIIIGEKGQAALRRDLSGKFLYTFLELSKAPLTFAYATAIADKVVAAKPDHVTLVFNYFKSKIAFETVRRTLPSMKTITDSKVESGSYEFDTDSLDSLYQFQLANTLYAAMVENTAVELSSRTMAMDNASRNANSMIERLQLFYNRSRQAVITRELIEIISGAAAV